MTAVNITTTDPICSYYEDTVHIRCGSTTIQYPVYYSLNPQLLPYISDHSLALVAPIVVYWIYSYFFYKLDTAGWKWTNKYRLHTNEEANAVNIASRSQVLRGVVLQQVLQTLLGLWWFSADESIQIDNHHAQLEYLENVMQPILLRTIGDTLGNTLLPDFAYFAYWWAVPVFQLLLAMFTVDTYFYFGHRLFHSVEFLYKNIHSHHHRLYVPYAYGALYNHPLEGLFLDSLGAVIAEAVAQMSTRQAMLLFVIATMKSVDDHAGYRFRFDPFQMFTENSAEYHDIHHQKIGLKSNFSQPFFVHWDKLLGTRMTRRDIEARKDKHQNKKQL